MSDHLPSSFPTCRLFGHVLEEHARLHCITIDGLQIAFSRTECVLMALLMHHAQHPGDFASFATLGQGLKRPPVDLRRLLSRRINEMRPKLWPFELDIISVRDQGYTLTRKWVPARSEAS